MEYVQLCFLYFLLLPRKLSILSLSRVAVLSTEPSPFLYLCDYIN